MRPFLLGLAGALLGAGTFEGYAHNWARASALGAVSAALLLDVYVSTPKKEGRRARESSTPPKGSTRQGGSQR